LARSNSERAITASAAGEDPWPRFFGCVDESHCRQCDRHASESNARQGPPAADCRDRASLFDRAKGFRHKVTRTPSTRARSGHHKHCGISADTLACYVLAAQPRRQSWNEKAAAAPDDSADDMLGARCRRGEGAPCAGINFIGPRR